MRRRFGQQLADVEGLRGGRLSANLRQVLLRELKTEQTNSVQRILSTHLVGLASGRAQLVDLSLNPGTECGRGLAKVPGQVLGRVGGGAGVVELLGHGGCKGNTRYHMYNRMIPYV